MKTRNRLLSLMLAFCMVLTLFPSTALADDTVQAEPGTVISTDGYYTSLIDENGILWTWGDSIYNDNQLGNGTTGGSNAPVKVIENAVSVVREKQFSEGSNAVITSDGSLWMWGQNRWGQLGIGTCESSSVPVKVLDNVASISLGGMRTAAVKTDGSLWTWGNAQGSVWAMLGNGTEEGSLVPIKVMDGVASVSCGAQHIAALKTDGSLWLWGDGSALGRGDITDLAKDEPWHSPVPIKIMDNVAHVCAGNTATVVIKTDGSLWAWGSDDYGILGDGLTDHAYWPVKVMDNVSSVTLYKGTGYPAVAAIKNDGSLWMWGSNNCGRLGNGTTQDSHIPVKILDDVASVSVGVSHTAAIKKDGSLWTWGWNRYGQLGTGTSQDSLIPAKVMDNAAVVALEVNNTFVGKTDRTVWVFGANTSGTLGLGFAGNSINVPTQNESLTVKVPGPVTPPGPGVDPDPGPDTPPEPTGSAAITALYPANGTTFDFADTSSDTRLRIFFDREVSDGGGGRPELDFSVGTLEVHKASDDSIVYQVQYGTEVSLWNVDGSPTAVVLKNATAALDYDTEYYVTMPEGFIKMADGSVSPAVEKEDWRFTTKVQQVVDPVPTQALYPFDWNENDSPINSLSDNLVITMTALAKLGYSTFSGSDKNKSVADFIDAKKYSEYSELYEKYSIDAIWDVSGRTLGSYGQFYRDTIGNYIVYDYCDSNSRTGFYAVCFKSPDGKYIISYRGSEGGMGAGIWHLIDSNSGTSSDWSTDLDFALRNTLSEQFSLALNFYFRIRDIAGEENIILTGHSLGGALAGYVSLCTGARAYTIDGAVGHIIDTTFWEPFWTVYNFTGVNNLNLVNLTDELGANLSWPIDVGDAIQATKLNKYPMVTYQSLHPRESTQVEGLFSNIAGSHHALSYLTYNQDTHRYTLGKQTMIYNCDAQWENDIVDYIPMIKAIISYSNLSTKLKNLFGQLIFNRGRVQLGTTGNDVIKAPSIIGIDSFVNNRQFGGYGTDKLTGYFDSDVLVSKGNGSVLDGQGGSDIYFIDDECRYTIIDDPGGNDTIILRNWDFGSITVQDTGEFVRIADSQRLVTVNKSRSIFSRNKIEVLWANDTCSQTKTVCSDLMQKAGQSNNRMGTRSLDESILKASAIRLIVIDGTAEISIYNSDRELISDTTFSNKDGDSTVYSDYAYYYGYNNVTDDRPYAVLYLFNDGYSVDISGGENISAALYQYDDSESELVTGSYIESILVPETQTLAIVSDGFEEGFYLVDGDTGIKIDDVESFVYAQSVSLSQTNISLKIGDSLTLFANVAPFEAIIDGDWYSSNCDVVTVDANGRVTACGIGIAEISFVTINGKTASCNVTVMSTGGTDEDNNNPSLPASGNPYLGTSSLEHIISVSSTSGGKISTTPACASKGRMVTLTSAPDEGYELTSLIVTDIKGNELELANKGDGKYTFVMPDSKVTVTAEFQLIQQGDSQHPQDPSWINPFTDVAESSWYYDAVRFVNENSLMNGISSTTFAPDANLSRAQLAQILYNKEGKPAVSDSSPFTDVAAGVWYSDAVIWAAANSIVGGYGNGLFGPDDNITREQLAVMLWRYAGEPVANIEIAFNDADQISDFAQAAIRWAVENGILNGKGNNILDPKGYATRAEVAQMLKNYLG